jgi:hypothetical protein
MRTMRKDIFNPSRAVRSRVQTRNRTRVRWHLRVQSRGIVYSDVNMGEKGLLQTQQNPRRVPGEPFAGSKDEDAPRIRAAYLKR